MFTTIITLALLAQAPAASPQPQVQRHESEYQRGIRELVAKHRAQRKAKSAARAARARDEVKARAIAQDQADREYIAMRPYLLEAQRQQLERVSAIERNAALDRMAAAQAAQAEAAQRAAQAYEWQVWKGGAK